MSPRSPAPLQSVASIGKRGNSQVAQQRQPWDPRLKVCVHSLGPEVSPFNPPRSVLQCGPPSALYCAQSLGRGPGDPAPLSEHARPQFPQDLSFPLLLKPAIPVLHWERSAETRGRGGLSPRGRSRPFVRLSVCGKKQVKPRRQSDGIGLGRSYSTHRG